MNVHNLMEEIVKQEVDLLYENAKNEKVEWLSCDCENCRLDTVSFVLNRIPPKYVVSGRGATHAAMDLENIQLQADVEALAMEGMRTVSSTKRPYHLDSHNDDASESVQSYFNFNSFTGRIFDGATFEPVSNATVLLKFEGETAQMIDSSWSNPYVTVDATKGSFSFWVKSVPASKPGEKKMFHFSIEINAPGYEKLIFHFELPVLSESGKRTNFDSTFAFRMNDFVIFKK